jgi:cytosine/adenosine deaminase-related metal-dependent hydrolase
MLGVSTLKGWLTNVKLETGFDTQDGITRTRTGLFSVLLKDGRFEQVTEGAVPGGAPAQDARGLLMLPGYADMHCHIDKTFFGDEWQAVITDPALGLPGFIEAETRLYPTLKTTTEYRAAQVLATFVRTGCTRVRTHVDIVKGLKAGHLDGVRRALAAFGPAIEHEIVAFPQHGLLRSDSYGSLDEALRNGATLLGGLDPNDMDGDRERSLALTMELAVKHNVGIDYHLHEGGEGGFASYRHFLRLIQEAGWQHRVTLSHAFFLRSLPPEQLEITARELAENGISLATAATQVGACPDFPFLERHGVHVMAGQDVMFDCWSPFCSGNIIERLESFCRMYYYRRERELAYSLRFITGGISPIGTDGERAWPRPGDAASFNLLDAACSAHVVARRREVVCAVRNGTVAHGGV